MPFLYIFKKLLGVFVLKRHNYWAYPGYLLFFIMLFAPISYKPLKIVLILIVLIITLASIYKNELTMKRQIFWLTWFFTLLGLFFMLLGLYRGNPGALQVGTVHVIWPWLYYIFIQGLNNKSTLINILKIMVFSSLAIELYSLSYIFYSKGTLPSYLYLNLDLGQSIGFYSGYTEFALNSLGSLVFLLPFIFAALCTWKDESEIPINRIWLWLCLIFGSIVLLLSGRRAFMLTTAFSPFVIFIISFFLPIEKRKMVNNVLRRLMIAVGILVVIGFSYLKLSLDYDFSQFREMVYSAFDFSNTGNESAYARFAQTHALIEGWSKHPFLGAGLGAQADVIRSKEMPWSYELQYLAYLFQTGIIGFICYFSGILWIFTQGIKIVKSGSTEGIMIIPILVGLMCFLIANGSNPYLNKYDFMWVIFLPIGFINYWLTKKEGI